MVCPAHPVRIDVTFDLRVQRVADTKDSATSAAERSPLVQRNDQAKVVPKAGDHTNLPRKPLTLRVNRPVARASVAACRLTSVKAWLARVMPV